MPFLRGIATSVCSSFSLGFPFRFGLGTTLSILFGLVDVIVFGGCCPCIGRAPLISVFVVGCACDDVHVVVDGSWLVGRFIVLRLRSRTRFGGLLLVLSFALVLSVIVVVVVKNTFLFKINS